jgi:hypothetical protein
MRYDHYASGQLYGIRYEFKNGEKLWPHAHVGESADQAHNIVVLRGTVLFDGVEQKTLVAGDIYDFDGTKPHSITALQDSVTLHLMLRGRPAEFAGYTEQQKHGEA